MGLEFLARVRGTTLWLGGVVALMIATYVVAALEPRADRRCRLVARESLSDRAAGGRAHRHGARRDARAAARRAWAYRGMLGLFLAGWALLTALPARWLMSGFLLPFAVMLFKAIAALLLESGFWSRLTRGPWRAALVVLAVALAAVLRGRARCRGAARRVRTRWRVARGRDTAPPSRARRARGGEEGSRIPHRGHAARGARCRMPVGCRSWCTTRCCCSRS